MRRTSRKLAAVAGAAAVAAAAFTANVPAAAAGSATETYLGVPIHNVALDRVAYGYSPAGKPEMYVVPLVSTSTTATSSPRRTAGSTSPRRPVPDGRVA